VVATIDVAQGPIVIDIPRGDIVGLLYDLWQRSLVDVGLSGPDTSRDLERSSSKVVQENWAGRGPDAHSVRLRGPASTCAANHTDRMTPPARVGRTFNQEATTAILSKERHDERKADRGHG
jgi:hypothetical protein